MNLSVPSEMPVSKKSVDGWKAEDGCTVDQRWLKDDNR